MTFDNSRFTFDPRKNYSGVVMEQGRVQLDADWNEWLAEIARRTQAGSLDFYGHAAYPPTTPSAFLITATAGSPNTVTIGAGRLYVDGLVAENHGSDTTATWDPALAELSNAPQPPNPASPNPNPLDYTKQPFLPGATVPAPPAGTTQSYVAYLDVWTRDVDYLVDPCLVDQAVGVDTTARLQTVWQVKFLANTASWTCATPDSTIFPPPVLGQLTTGVVGSNASTNSCCMTDSTGYTGVENQFYRVEIHTAGTGGATASAATATFKWSRDDASVETLVLGIATVQNTVGSPASALTVTSLGRDEVLGFHAGDWIEILDDWTDLYGQTGSLCQIDSVNASPPTIILTTIVNTTQGAPGAAAFPVNTQGQTDATRHTRIRRWDQRGTVYDTNGNPWCDVTASKGQIPVPTSGTTLVLENGVTVQFNLPAGGAFRVGDYWTFAARTADGSVEKLNAAPPRGIHHHCTKLAVVTLGTSVTYTDCRTPAGNAGEGGCGCCTVTVGDGVTSVGQFTSIQAAIQALPATGGEVAILPGRYYEYVTIANVQDVVVRGCGPATRLASPSMKAGQAPAKATPSGSFAAIVTVSGSMNVELRSFAIEAATGEAGILVEPTLHFTKVLPLPKGAVDPNVWEGVRSFPTNIAVRDLVITASTLPAVMASQVQHLELTGNRVAMQDVIGQWPSAWLSGNEIRVERNWIGLQNNADAGMWMPASVVADVPSGFKQTAAALPAANGGIQIGSYSTDVCIADNVIEGGARNGVTLGSFSAVVVATSKPYSQTIFGLYPTAVTSPPKTFTLELPANVTIAKVNLAIQSGGPLQDVRILRNRITGFGLCGVGPVGFFDATTTLDSIQVEDLAIVENVISSTLQGAIAPPASAGTGYGAICLADAEVVTLRDNVVTDFGDTPGAAVSGVYILSGEQVEVRGNRILETRDWAAAGSPDAAVALPQAGISIWLVTPPALDPTVGGSAFSQGGGFMTPYYQPGLPAVRIVDNVVRVALGRALEVVGFGPFAIDGNQLATGGAIPGPAPGTLMPGIPSVLVLNLGSPIDVATVYYRYIDLFNANAPSLQVAQSQLEASSSGSVLFRNNRVQLEARASFVPGVSPEAAASVAIFSLDHVLLSDNHTWVDGGARGNASFDVVLLATCVQATGNRFQEAAGAVSYSALALGSKVLATNNLATYCIGAFGGTVVQTPNLIMDSSNCQSTESTRESGAVVKEPMNANVVAADGVATQRIQTLGAIRQARLVQRQRTLTYVTAQYGASSPQVTTAQAAVTSAQAAVVRASALELQRSTTAPTAPKNGWSLYGHVYGAQLEPRSSYTVFVVDQKNAYQASIGFAYTASDGSYQLDYAPAHGASHPANLFLQITNDKGQPVYLGSAPLQVQTSVATPLDVTLPTGEPVIGDPPAALRAIALPPTGGATTGGAHKDKDKDHDR